jgi:hypothetical protein
MADIFFRLAVIAVSAVVLGHSLPRIMFALRANRSPLRKW